MKVKTNYAVSILALGEGFLGKLIPLPLLCFKHCRLPLCWGGCWDGFPEGYLKDKGETDLASLPNCPARSVHNCDFLLQLLSLASEAIIQFLLGGHQRGQPTRRCMLGVAYLSTEVLNHWASADVIEGPGCG